ncbi:hypothetical protein KO494_14630 [Lacinutrix sp. C3R15]|uniref:hypothetical protein n=1 Tax=Flavobacteriaceae TaxID=49546 RepID=UPI001C08E644|nr:MULTISPECIES: hypothetical protein [Flavobacteriaceae]MBU2940781.1 hypothetical protein [Lacinutrix sp. C3R15]MDO6624099.1 hypothetical protein [Oceanihabitans sp. 1_MG-2023]
MMNVFQNIKTRIVLLVIVLLQTSLIHANNIEKPCNNHEPFKVLCDLCGCSTSSGSFGFGTLSNANFVGVRYIYQNFESRNGIFENSPTSKEHFNTYQLWAQIPITNSFYVSANLPYQDLTRDFNKVKENINGLGDASVIGWYKLPFYKKKDANKVDFNTEREASGHSLQFGLGIKLPTGKFEESLADNINPGFQVGTGSVDGIFSLGYNYGGDKYGVNTLFSYYLKGENKNDYQFGNQFSYATNLYRSFATEKMNIMPFVGVSGDVYETITQYGETIADTDGNIFNASVGSELAIEKFIFGASYTLPISQSLFGDNVESKQRVSVYVNFAL